MRIAEEIRAALKLNCRQMALKMGMKDANGWITFARSNNPTTAYTLRLIEIAMHDLNWSALKCINKLIGRDYKSHK